MNQCQDYFYPVPRGIAMGAAKIVEPDQLKVSDFNKRDLKGNATTFAISFKVGKPDIPEKLAKYDAYPGVKAVAEFGADVDRHPESYNTYDLRCVPLPEMPQFLPNTRARRINAFDAQ